MFNGDPAKNIIVEIEIGMLIGPFAAAMCGKGKAHVAQIGHARVVLLDLVENDRIRRAGFDNITERAQQVVTGVVGRDVEVKLRFLQPPCNR